MRITFGEAYPVRFLKKPENTSPQSNWERRMIEMLVVDWMDRRGVKAALPSYQGQDLLVVDGPRHATATAYERYEEGLSEFHYGGYEPLPDSFVKTHLPEGFGPEVTVEYRQKWRTTTPADIKLTNTAPLRQLIGRNGQSHP